MPVLFYDTETGGKANQKQPATHPSQPDLVQLGAVLTDDALNEIAVIDVVVYPGAWEIPKEATAIHGISQEMAETYGVGLTKTLAIFCDMAATADRIVAHNAEFDVLVIRRALARIEETPEARPLASALGLIGLDPFEDKEIRCTMRAAKRILKLPNRNPHIQDQYKFPRLEECIKHFFDEDFEGAHNALYDVRGTIRVYREICQRSGMAP